MLRLYIQPKRALRQGRATVRFETPPGQQLQSDWGEVAVEFAGVLTKVYFIVNELAYSRRFHFWCTDSADAEHTYKGLLRSLEYFGGVPQEVLVDNQKAAVLTPAGHERRAALQRTLSGSRRPLRLSAPGLPAVPGPHQGQGQAYGGLHQTALLCALPPLHLLGASQPAGRSLTARGSRPTPANHRQRGGQRSLYSRGTDAARPARRSATTPPITSCASCGWDGYINMPRQSLSLV